MTSLQGNVSENVSVFAGMEHQLSAALLETAEEIAHVECFDEEQRSEVYAILQALKSDTDAHQLMVTRLIEQLKGGRADA